MHWRKRSIRSIKHFRKVIATGDDGSMTSETFLMQWKCRAKVCSTRQPYEPFPIWRASEFGRWTTPKLVGNANEFYELFANHHHIVPAPSMMCVDSSLTLPPHSSVLCSAALCRNGRLPTKLFTNEYHEKQKQRAKPVRQPKMTQEELEKSRTRPEEVRGSIQPSGSSPPNLGQRLQFGIGGTNDQTDHAHQTMFSRSLQKTRMQPNGLFRIHHRSHFIR